VQHTDKLVICYLCSAGVGWPHIFVFWWCIYGLEK